MEFRKLKAAEIDVRVGSISAKGATLLLYKDARVDQTILDETVGAMNWQRHHSRDNANCIVSIWDDKKKQWIEKEDTGSESFTEKEKGLASDSFKRACFNWGIGRELYSAPFIFIPCGTLKNGRKYELEDRYFFNGAEVTEIEYTGSEISYLVIEKKGVQMFKYGKKRPCKARNTGVEVFDSPSEENPVKEEIRKKVLEEAHKRKITPQELAKDYGLTKETTVEEFDKVLHDLVFGEEKGNGK